jgi:hypothetical protein
MHFPHYLHILPLQLLRSIIDQVDLTWRVLGEAGIELDNVSKRHVVGSTDNNWCAAHYPRHPLGAWRCGQRARVPETGSASSTTGKEGKGKPVLECPMSSKVLFQFVESQSASICAVPSMLNLFQALGYGAQQTGINVVTRGRLEIDEESNNREGLVCPVSHKLHPIVTREAEKTHPGPETQSAPPWGSTFHRRNARSGCESGTGRG